MTALDALRCLGPLTVEGLAARCDLSVGAAGDELRKLRHRDLAEGRGFEGGTGPRHRLYDLTEKGRLKFELACIERRGRARLFRQIAARLGGTG